MPNVDQNASQVQCNPHINPFYEFHMHIQTNNDDILCQLKLTVRLGGVAKCAKGREHMLYLKTHINVSKLIKLTKKNPFLELVLTICNSLTGKVTSLEAGPLSQLNS